VARKKENPGARAGAHRADVIKLVGKIDVRDSTANALELQVRRLTRRYAISLSLALVVAELAFSSERRA
jgi:hypothetical protein